MSLQPRSKEEILPLDWSEVSEVISEETAIEQQDQQENSHDKSTPPLELLHSISEENTELDEEDIFQINDEVFDRLEKSLNNLRAYNTRLKARYDLNNGATEEQQKSQQTEQAKDNQQQTQQEKASQGKGFLQTIQTFFLQSLAQPKVVAKHYGSFAEKFLDIIQQQSDLAPTRGDRRFKDQVWKENFLYRSVLQVYIAWQEEMQSWLNELELSGDDQERAQFILDQLVAALAPSNFPWNPAAVKRAYQTGGTSVVTGVKELVDDLLHNKGMPKQIRPDAYELGKDLALSPGQVVYRDERLELIQYEPKAEAVRERPILLIPPQINKFYIFDLTPKNSIVKHLLESGLQVFIVSWKNPSKTQADWGLDSYIKSVMGAMEASRSITQSDQINLISACAGGLTSMSLIGYLAEQEKHWVHSHSLLVTSLEAHNGSILDLFATKELIESARVRSAEKGIMDGNELAKVFAWLRPNDLVWSYWVNNYLLGKEPPALDVLYWDNDSTRLPAALHSDFLSIFSKETFTTPKTLTILGTPIDFNKVTMDTYFVGGTEDYLMPWRSCYNSTQLVKGNHSFVLSSSGHVQSILRPMNVANTTYYTNTNLSLNADDWYASAEKQDGSWWGHWSEWLNERSGELVCAPKTMGNKDYPALMPAPGSYVLEK